MAYTYMEQQAQLKKKFWVQKNQPQPDFQQKNILCILTEN